MKIMKADTFKKRLVGLLKHQSLDQDSGLLLENCRQVHTFGMRFPITVIYLDEEYTFLYKELLMPNKIGSKIRHCHYILEVSADNYCEINEDKVRRMYDQFI